MEIFRRVTADRKAHLPLLLEADPDEHMNRPVPGAWPAICAGGWRQDRGGGRHGGSGGRELRVEEHRRGSQLPAPGLRLAAAAARDGGGGPTHPWMFVGTTAPTEPFYAQLGFAYSHTVKNFFVDNYPEPIFEDGIQCIDMRYLKRRIKP